MSYRPIPTDPGPHVESGPTDLDLGIDCFIRIGASEFSDRRDCDFDTARWFFECEQWHTLKDHHFPNRRPCTAQVKDLGAMLKHSDHWWRTYNDWRIIYSFDREWR